MVRLDQQIALDIYEKMTLIRETDDRFRKSLLAGAFTGIHYSPRGQEAIAAAIGVCLRPDDYLVTTYRGLHDQLAKGLPLRELWAEFLGKSTGTCKGKGGTMHISHPPSGVMLTTAIVGGGIPVAAGLALAAQAKGTDQVTVCNFGDGATNIGAFHEALNIASLWNLPVLFVCQNNRYAENTPFEHGTKAPNVASRAASYGMTGVTVDGNDPVAVWEAAQDAISRARGGDGPTLLEAVTFRFMGHYFGDPFAIPDDVMSAALERDPYPRYRRRLVDEGYADDAALAVIDARVVAAVDDAVEFAVSSPEPTIDELFRDVYAEEVAG